MATAKPVTNELSAKLSWMESTAPLMTELSKPNRKPPTAAATVTAMTFAACAVDGWVTEELLDRTGREGGKRLDTVCFLQGNITPG